MYTDNSIKIKVFVKKDDQIKEAKTIECSLNQKIIDMKHIILTEIFNNDFNDLDIENITERVYKDYGKLFFDKGLLPITIDNYKFSQFTNENRTFDFLVFPKNTIKKTENKKVNSIDFEKYRKGNEKEKEKKLFHSYDTDFPPL
jgi:hypothetical protein